MNQTEFIADLQAVYAKLVVEFVGFLPKLLGALGVVVVGYLVAHLLRLAIRRLLEKVDRLLPAQVSRRTLDRLGDRSAFAELVSRVIFWFVIFISLTVATEVVELNVVSTWLSGLTTYLPQLLAAVLVGFVGIAAGKIVREMIARFSQSMGVRQPQALGQVAQVVILVATGIIVAGQIGIEVAFLTQLAMILVASVVGGAALAFGLGSRTMVTNILAAHYLRRQYHVGETVEIGDHRGRIVEITATAVILHSDAGQVLVPAKAFEEGASVLVTPGS